MIWGWYLMKQVDLLLKLGLELFHAADGALIVADDGPQGGEWVS